MDPAIAGTRNLLPVAYLHASMPAGDNFPLCRGRLAAATRKAAAPLPVASVRADLPTLDSSHTRSPIRPPTPTPGVELARSERCGPARRQHRGVRAVDGGQGS